MMVAELILNSVTSFIGLLFLWIKFRGRKSFKELRKEAEDESFAFEGGKVILFIVGIIMLTATLTFLFAFIIRLIADFFKNL